MIKRESTLLMILGGCVAPRVPQWPLSQVVCGGKGRECVREVSTQSHHLLRRRHVLAPCQSWDKELPEPVRKTTLSRLTEDPVEQRAPVYSGPLLLGVWGAFEAGSCSAGLFALRGHIGALVHRGACGRAEKVSLCFWSMRTCVAAVRTKS